MIDPETSVPEESAEPKLDSFVETPPSIEDRVAQTDAHLSGWRSESVRRREEWEVAEAERMAEIRALRRMLLPLMVAVVVLATTTTVLLVMQFSADPVVAEVAPVVAEAAPVVAEVAPVVSEAAPVVAEPTVEAEATALVPAMQADAAVPVDPETVAFWRDDEHHWVRFVVGTEEPIWMHWRDALGDRVLEPMGCAAASGGVHACLAGRTHDRIHAALEAGAQPGSWTVEACGPAGCSPVGSFVAP